MEATHKALQSLNSDATSVPRPKAEIELVSRAQSESFPEEFQAIKKEKEIFHHDRLSTLSPENAKTLRVIRVGGRQSSDLDSGTIHDVICAWQVQKILTPTTPP